MIWLAGAIEGGTSHPAGTTLELLSPHGELDRFPRRFAWSPIEGADLYEIFVASVDEEARPLFRQRGPSCELELAVDDGAEPPPGEYAWEVLALRAGRTLARAAGTFAVRTNGQSDSMR